MVPMGRLGLTEERPWRCRRLADEQFVTVAATQFRKQGQTRKDQAKAQREAKIQPHRLRDDRRRKPMALVADGGRSHIGDLHGLPSRRS